MSTLFSVPTVTKGMALLCELLNETTGTNTTGGREPAKHRQTETWPGSRSGTRPGHARTRPSRSASGPAGRGVRQRCRGELGWECLWSVGVQPAQLLRGHLERVGRFGRCPNDQPELIVVGVVEHLPHLVGFDEQRVVGLEREKLVSDSNATNALQQHVQLLRLAVAML